MAIIVEACIESAEAAIIAERAGADRVELCANLLEGGTTPSCGTIQLARQQTKIGICVMIRPRGGDFCYSEIEFEVMKKDIEMAKTLGADGVVFGILTEEGEIDRHRTKELIDLARPMTVTIHRAFDMTRDPFSALETLIDLFVDRILTSGQRPSAMEGLDLLTLLVKKAEGQIVIMPGGGIDEETIGQIVTTSGAREVHVAALVSTESRMKYRNEKCFMGIEEGESEYAISATDPLRLKSMVRKVQEASR